MTRPTNRRAIMRVALAAGVAERKPLRRTRLWTARLMVWIAKALRL